MKTVQYHSTLFYYDGPQVIEARDSIGGHYIGLMVEIAPGLDRFLIAGVAPERLRKFRSGVLDLREVLTEADGEDWYLADMMGEAGSCLQLERQTASLESSGFLPEPGFFLHEQPAGEEALKEARARNNLVLEVAVEPPEAAQEHRIRVSTLAGLLGHIQTLIKHAYGAALRGLSMDARHAIDRSDAHLLDVIIPAAPGSFRVFLEAAKAPNLFGQSELERALARVDSLFVGASDPQVALAAAKLHRGHLAGAYLRLLRFLQQNQTGLRYSYADPSFKKSRSGQISEAEVGVLVRALSGISNLGSEPVELDGVLEKADAVSGSWRLATNSGAYSGRVKDGGPTLEGLQIGSSYRFSCLEEIEEVEGTGRELRTLYLTERALL